jgi:hypothetical protein
MDSINQELVERERQRLELTLNSPFISSLSQNEESASKKWVPLVYQKPRFMTQIKRA